MKRTVRLRMCESKVRYNDPRAVERAISFNARIGYSMKAYRCKRCGAFHLTKDVPVAASPMVPA